MLNIKNIGLLLGLSLLAGVGCSATKSSSVTEENQLADSSYLAADFSEAIKVARVSSVQKKVTSPDDFSSEELVTIDAFGRLRRLFNRNVSVYKIERTTNYLIVDGNFTSEIMVANTNGLMAPDRTCFLLAIPLKSKGNPKDIICLYERPAGSSDGIGNFDPYLSAIAPSSTHYGFAIRGQDVYFTTCSQQHELCDGTLYKWTEGDLSPTVLFTAPPAVGCTGACSGLDDIFLDPNSNNLCVFGGTTGVLYCGTDTSLTLVPTPAAAETRMLGNWILTVTKKIDIRTTVTAANAANIAVSRSIIGGTYPSESGLPQTLDALVSDAAGGFITRGFAGSLAHTDSFGNSTILGGQMSGYQQVFAVGNYVWTWSVPWQTNNQWDYALSALCSSYSQCGPSYGDPPTSGQRLQRIAVSSPNALDLIGDGNNGGNYLSNIGMDYVLRMSLNREGRLVITGRAGGATVSATIDGNGNITTNSSTDIPLDQFISL